jgi:hypothetical protein
LIDGASAGQQAEGKNTKAMVLVTRDNIVILEDSAENEAMP